eukprot:NODE_214_length_12495_cov_0.543078.p5 type:complete len:257 gc:universal NODE_214_length_12495_cov_0.543078:1081-311(-)
MNRYLPEEVHFKIFEYLNEDDVLSLKKCNSKLNHIIKQYEKPLGKINLRIAEFISNLDYFKHLLIENGAVISGSFLLQVILKTKFLGVTEMDISIPNIGKSFENIIGFLVSFENYIVFEYSSDLTIMTRKKGRVDQKINLIQSGHCPSTFIKKNYALSCTQIWYDGTKLSSPHLPISLEKIAIFVVNFHWLIATTTTELLKKYYQFGFKIYIMKCNIPFHHRHYKKLKHAFAKTNYTDAEGHVYYEILHAIANPRN